MPMANTLDEVYMYFTPFGPEESYSRHLDREVSAQEFPYGKPYNPEFLEVEMKMRKVENIDKKGGTDRKKK